MTSPAPDNLLQISDHAGFKSALRGKEDFWSIDTPSQPNSPVLYPCGRHLRSCWRLR